MSSPKNEDAGITPGGNPVCTRCGTWYVLGTEHDCVETLTQQLQASGPDEYPEGYYRYLAEKQLEEIDKEGAS